MTQPAKNNRQKAYRRGLLAEWLAAALLVFTGHKIAAWRYKTPYGEIDLVARKGKTLIFVEVKCRRHLAGALEAVHIRNRARVSQAAGHYLASHSLPPDTQPRFDVIATAGLLSWQHIVNAWQE